MAFHIIMKESVSLMICNKVTWFTTYFEKFTDHLNVLIYLLEVEYCTSLSLKDLKSLSGLDTSLTTYVSRDFTINQLSIL